MKSIQVKETGGPERMELVETPTPKPSAKQALVRIAFSGVNFIDVYFRTGLYKSDLPVTLGSEASGTVEAVGPEVTGLAPGDRVAYAMVRGSYAEFAPRVRRPARKDSRRRRLRAGRCRHAAGHDRALPHPFDISAQGRRCRLVHASAGGSGRLIVQMAKARGARVFGTVSTDAKARVAREAGADETILYTQQDFEVEARRLTGGRGVDVVYDSVGKTTFDKSLGALRPRGMLALFGQSSGSVPPVDPSVLVGKGSLFLTRPSLAHYVATRDELLWRAGDVLKAVQDGTLTLKIDKTYPLADAASAHRDLESRRTAGKLLLEISGR